MSHLGNRVSLPGWIWRHPSNQGRRFRALRDAGMFQVRGRLLGRPTVVRVGRSASLEARVGYPGASRVIYANPPDFAEMHYWERRLRHGDLFIDVGANVGVYSLWAADCGAEVIAVEPGRRALGLLERNVALNDFNISVMSAALANFEGTSVIDASRDTTARLGQGKDSVTVTTLDAILGERVAAGVKIDVEGAERLVLEGGARALSDRRVHCLQLEWNRCSEEHARRGPRCGRAAPRAARLSTLPTAQ